MAFFFNSLALSLSLSVMCYVCSVCVLCAASFVYSTTCIVYYILRCTVGSCCACSQSIKRLLDKYGAVNVGKKFFFY